MLIFILEGELVFSLSVKYLPISDAGIRFEFNTMGLAEYALSLVTVTNILLSFVAYIVLKFVYQIVHYRFFHPLSAFPGPFWASVTRLWIAKQNLQETEYLTLYDLSKNNGKSGIFAAAEYAID